MTRDDILALFDVERRETEIPGFRLEATPNLVRDLSLDPAHPDSNWINWSRHTASEIDAAIEAEVAYFSALRRRFEWKVYDHDQPPDLRDRLAAHGFEVGEVEAFMVLDTLAAPAVWFAPLAHDVRRLTDPDHLADYAAVEHVVWEKTHMADFANVMRTRPDIMGLYVAYVDGRPAACARASFSPGSPFCGLWGGATLPEFRNRGLYMALVGARVQEAARRGARFVTIDAAPTSRPILEKRGFQHLANTYPCVYGREPAVSEPDR